MIQPIRNNVLVRPIKTENISKGGIIVAESFAKDSNKVEIVEVGPGTSKKPMKLKKGQIGYRVQDWGTEVMQDGIKYFLMDESAIIATE